MSFEKKGIKTKLPKEKVLVDAKLGINTINALTGNIGKINKTEISEVTVHDAVAKMHKSQKAEDKLSDKELKRVREINRIKNKSAGINTKISKLEERKKTFQNTKKLSYELEIEEKRRQSKLKSGKTLAQVTDLQKLNAEAAMMFTSSGQSTKYKIKDNSKMTKTRNLMKSEVFDIFDTKDSKKYSFKKDGFQQKQSVRGANLLAKLGPVSESSKFFAKEFGWVEDDRPKRVFYSPLQDYKVEKNDSNQNNELEEVEVVEEIQTTSTQDNLDFERQNSQEEMDLKTINELAKKFAKEAEEAKKIIENSQKDNSHSVSEIYNKILNQSPILKLSRQQKNKNDDISADIDISKIPSIVLEGKK
ncbi:hypothetical protein SCHIN_v1c05090 [Spiroplasma chinense]|uniref:Uncharacterized protein n=1 Tax=Spiroplasma chinense TaxID=216932 RepID=A0A5B9Y4T7_9MOLU|nr:hypothetical protein [Spiroplasma chinense]QEH61706.1 hypothetical protein SCHIN_v1c05090 [Spiroplasma chinense]